MHKNKQRQKKKKSNFLVKRFSNLTFKQYLNQLDYNGLVQLFYRNFFRGFKIDKTLFSPTKEIKLFNSYVNYIFNKRFIDGLVFKSQQDFIILFLEKIMKSQIDKKRFLRILSKKKLLKKMFTNDNIYVINKFFLKIEIMYFTIIYYMFGKYFNIYCKNTLRNFIGHMKNLYYQDWGVPKDKLMSRHLSLWKYIYIISRNFEKKNILIYKHKFMTYNNNFIFQAISNLQKTNVNNEFNYLYKNQKQIYHRQYKFANWLDNLVLKRKRKKKNVRQQIEEHVNYLTQLKKTFQKKVEFYYSTDILKKKSNYLKAQYVWLNKSINLLEILYKFFSDEIDENEDITFKQYDEFFKKFNEITNIRKKLFIKFFFPTIYYIRNNAFYLKKRRKRRMLPKKFHLRPVLRHGLEGKKFTIFERKRKKNFKEIKIKRLENLFLFNPLNKRRGHKKKAILYFQPRYSNYYISLLDMHYKPICIYSAGRVLESYVTQKKIKLSTIYCNAIFSRMLKIIRKFRIKILFFEIRDSFDKHFRAAYKFFTLRGIKVPLIKIDRRIPHHLGLKKRKLRRI